MTIATLLAALFAATSQTPAPPAGATTPPVKVMRYCIRDRREGAIDRRRICRTREAWQARGFDPVVALGGR
ncbi:hypothetical protein QLH51_10595 [Sphingomonas sp. 2R-10]|uniref:hypothetical protein n=1 Tax=Sphingomonas sp. 2R-10 TaxID=3045148 RepID=UPI000F77C274|nr:hypothetical protein [Sphingomonas sp. 2R-10]MDJ0277242.1 hypothetical protein [Sphingomonas sp. 2R-10]